MTNIKVNVENLIVGNVYYVECGLWTGNVVYVGSFLDGKRLKYRFTFGSLFNWQNQFNIVACKSKLKIFVV